VKEVKGFHLISLFLFVPNRDQEIPLFQNRVPNWHHKEKPQWNLEMFLSLKNFDWGES